MAEVLVQFDDSITGSDGRAYTPRACGADVGGLWQGWIEFVAEDGTTLRTTRETTQPNRKDLSYWAQGLTHVYLEGALRRALEPPPAPHDRHVDVSPAYGGPADEPAARRSGPAAVSGAILDPFRVYLQGERVLRQELGALDVGHLRDIARSYRLIDGESWTLERMDSRVLIEAIVDGTRRVLESSGGSTSDQAEGSAHTPQAPN